MKDILDSQEFYEVMQQYRHCNMDNQEAVVKAFENVKTWIRDNVQGNVDEQEQVFANKFVDKLKEVYINTQAPEWLTSKIRKQVKETWDSHKVCNDHKRIDAMQIVRNAAKDNGYEISIKKAMELMKQFCRIYV